MNKEKPKTQTEENQEKKVYFCKVVEKDGKTFIIPQKSMDLEGFKKKFREKWGIKDE